MALNLQHILKCLAESSQCFVVTRIAPTPERFFSDSRCAVHDRIPFFRLSVSEFRTLRPFIECVYGDDESGRFKINDKFSDDAHKLAKLNTAELRELYELMPEDAVRAWIPPMIPKGYRLMPIGNPNGRPKKDVMAATNNAAQ